MRVLLFILIGSLLCAASCTQQAKPKIAPVKTGLSDWIRSTNVSEKHKHTLIFAVSPVDCINCKIAFTQVFRQVAEKANPATRIVLLFPTLRKIEREAAIHSFAENLPPKTYETVFNDTLFEDAIAQVKTGKGISALLIYNSTGELNYAAFGKSILGTEPELVPFLKDKF